MSATVPWFRFRLRAEAREFESLRARVDVAELHVAALATPLGGLL